MLIILCYFLLRENDISNMKQIIDFYSHKNQAEIIQGFKFKRNGNIKDNVCTALLNEILGGSPSSRLFSDLREKRHLAYSVRSNYDVHGDMGVIYLKIGTTTENKETGEKTFDNLQKSIKGFQENIDKIKTEKVSEEELEAAKKQLKTAILESVEMNKNKNNRISKNINTPYSIEYTNKYYDCIDSISPDDILNTAQNIFNSKTIYSLTATKETLDANKEFLESLKD